MFLKYKIVFYLYITKPTKPKGKMYKKQEWALCRRKTNNGLNIQRNVELQ